MMSRITTALQRDLGDHSRRYRRPEHSELHVPPHQQVRTSGHVSEAAWQSNHCPGVLAGFVSHYR
jgi:hypothetical protein